LRFDERLRRVGLAKETERGAFVRRGELHLGLSIAIDQAQYHGLWKGPGIRATIRRQQTDACPNAPLIIDDLERAGLIYFEDFFELSGNWPDWLQLFAGA